MEAELKSAESSTGRVRIKELESKVRQLELELSRSVPLSIHDEAVSKHHQLSPWRMLTAQITRYSGTRLIDYGCGKQYVGWRTST